MSAIRFFLKIGVMEATIVMLGKGHGLYVHFMDHAVLHGSGRWGPAES
jgi:hypothetical protein